MSFWRNSGGSYNKESGRKDADEIRNRIEKRGDTEMVERALFLKEKLENAMENREHIYDNTGKSMEEETEEIAVLMKSRSLMIKEEE